MWKKNGQDPGPDGGLHKVKTMASTQPGVTCALTNGSELMEKNQASEGERWVRREARASNSVAVEGPTEEMAGLKLKKVEGEAKQIPGSWATQREETACPETRVCEEQQASLAGAKEARE